MQQLPYEGGGLPYEGSGGLRVSVRTADNALPIASAAVTVWDARGGPPIATLVTDRSGNTEVLTLPTPRASASLSPGSAEAYAVYRIRVEREGYYRQDHESVPIFDGVLSLQNAALIPRAPYEGERAAPQGSTHFTAGQTLEGGQ